MTMTSKQYQWIGERLLSDDTIEKLIYDMIHEDFEYNEIRLFYPWLTNKEIDEYFREEVRHCVKQEKRVKEIADEFPDC